MSDEPETAPALEPAPVADAAPAEPTGNAAIVLAWVNEFVDNSPVSRSVEAINYMNETAIPALIARLNAAP